MAQLRKMSRQVNVKSNVDVIHEIFRDNPNHISDMSPAHVQGVHLLEGNWGTVGSVICWNYTQDGKQMVSKEVIEAIDDNKKSVTFRVIDGDLLKLYKSFVFIFNVDTVGDDNLVTWTLNYEKLNEDVEDPHSLMELCIKITKSIENHHPK